MSHHGGVNRLNQKARNERDAFLINEWLQHLTEVENPELYTARMRRRTWHHRGKQL